MAETETENVQTAPADEAVADPTPADEVKAEQTTPASDAATGTVPPKTPTNAETPQPPPVEVNKVDPSAPIAGEPAQVIVTHGEAPRQMIGEQRPAPVATPVHEVYHKGDQVILDPNSPLAVQPGPKDADPHPDPRTPEQKLTDEQADE